MVTIQEKPTTADFPIEIQDYKARSPLDTGASVSCMSYNRISYYRKFITKPDIKRNIHAKMTLAD